MRRKTRRVALTLVGALALLLLMLVLATNVVLMTSLGPSLASTGASHVTWERGYALFPTRVHLRGVDIRVDGKNTSWHLAVGRVDADVSLQSWLGGEIHATRAEADDITVVGAPIAGEEPPDAPPPAPAPGAAPIALVKPLDDPKEATPDTEIGDGDRTLRIDRLVATNLREMSLGDVAYRGAASLQGDLSAYERGALRFEHATLDASSGELLVEGERLLEAVRGHVTIDRSRVDVDAPAREVWLGTTDGGMELDAVVTGANLVARPASRAPSSNGTVRASLRIAGGALAKGSTAALRVPETPPLGDAAPFSADVVFGVGEGGRATLTALAREMAWPPASGDEARVSVSELRVALTSPEVRLADPAVGIEGTADATGIRLALDRIPLVRALVREREGGLRGEAHLAIVRGEASGPIAARADDVALALGEATVDGDLAIEGALHRYRLGSHQAELTATATHSPEGGAPGSTATLTLDDAVVRLGEAPVLDAKAQLRMSDAHLALEALFGQTRLPPLVNVVAGVAPIDTTASIHAEREAIVARDIDGRIGLVSVRGRLRYPREGARQGTLLLEAGPFATGVSIEGPKTTLVLFDAERWFEEALAAP